MKSSLDYDVLEKGQYSIDMPAQHRMVRNQKSFDEIYQKLKTNTHPKPETPIVDFENYDMLFIHFGSFNQGGHSYTLETINWDDNILYLAFTSPKRNKNTPVTMALTQPYMFILIDKLAEEPDNIVIEKL